MTKRLTEKQKEEIVESFKSGKDIDTLALEYNCTNLTITRNLKKNLGERKYKELLIQSKKYDQSIEIQNTLKIGNNSSEEVSTINPFMEIIPLNCDIENNAGNINAMNNVFINYFLDQGYKNPYDSTITVVYTARNGSNDTNGRMRFDETECSSGSQKKQIALWVKTHVADDYKPELISKDGWCN